jgi:hypothetical protein
MMFCDDVGHIFLKDLRGVGHERCFDAALLLKGEEIE